MSGPSLSTHQPQTPSLQTRGERTSESEIDTTALAQNPMMDRVQSALRRQLQKTHDRIKIEFLEQERASRVSEREREDCGVRLYGMQQQLARLQTKFDKQRERNEEAVREREEGSERVRAARANVLKKKKEVDRITKTVATTRAEVHAVNETIRQVKKYDNDMKGEISVARRAASKAEENVKALEKDKKTQDFYIDGLNERVKKLENEVILTDAHLDVQRERTGLAKEMIRETSEELDLLVFEKKQLVQQWNSSIMALKRRDEALTAASRAYKEAQSSIKDKEGEIDGLKREISETRFEKESSVSVKDRMDVEIKFLEEKIREVQYEQGKTSDQFQLLQKSISNTNVEELKIAGDIKKTRSEISTIDNKIQMITRERRTLEEQIGSTKCEQTTLTKAKKSYLKDKTTLRIKIHDKEIEASNIQNELARIKIDTLNTQVHSDQLKQKRGEASADLQQKDAQIQQAEANVHKRNNEIEMKMNRVDRLNRTYEKIMDGVDEPEPLGPLEYAAKGLSKEIDAQADRCQILQREWLRDQTALVQTISAADSIQEHNAQVHAKLNILNQKRLRLLQDIHTNDLQVKAVDTGVQCMHSDMTRLNDLIGKNVAKKVELFSDNAFREKEFVQELKEMEQEAVRMEQKISQVKAAKEKLSDEIMHIRQQILHWEKKIQMEKEKHMAIESSSDIAEMKGMEREIQRMKHRLESMAKDQEKTIREIEQAIYKREDIAVKYQHGRSRTQKSGCSMDTGSGASKNRMNGNSTMSKAETKKLISEKKTQLKKIQRNGRELTDKIEEHRSAINEISVELKEMHQQLNSKQNQSRALQEDINNKLFEKQRLLAKFDRKKELTAKYHALQAKNMVPNPSSTSADYHQNQFEVEKSLALTSAKMKRIRNVIAGLRLKCSDGLKDVLERVECLASDVVSEFEQE